MFAKLVRFPIVRTRTALILLKTRHLGKKKKERWIVVCNLASKVKNSMREMKTTKAIKAIAILAIISAICACRKMDIDPQQMKDITLGEFPIDTVDSHHDWNLVQQMMVCNMSWRLRFSALGKQPAPTSPVPVKNYT